jgi:hypothetical protein
VREINSSNFAIIAGLPRSGTAWLAAALNLHPRIFAFHEAALTGENYTRRIQNALESSPVVIDCTTNLNPAFDEVPALRFFLYRNPLRCLASSVKKFGQLAADVWPAAETLAETWRQTHTPILLSFEDMVGSREGRQIVMNAICRYMGIPNEISPAKLDLLAGMNIQMNGLHPDYFKDKEIQTVP